MIREVILNSFASTLSKNDRDGLNSAARSLIANPKTFLDNKTFNEFQDWLGYRGGCDGALSPLTLRVFSIVADKLGVNAVHVYELWESDQLIFYTIQATDKYPFNIFIDDDLGKHYLEKAMGAISLHYEDWEV